MEDKDSEQKAQKNGLIIFYQASACLTSEVIDSWAAEAEQAYMKAAGRRADRKCCKEKWGIDERFTDFGLPFDIVFYMPNGAIMLGSMIWVLSATAGGCVDPVLLSKIILVSIIVAIAAPPIPGSALAILPILFSACGTDISLMPLAVLVGSTLGYVLPAMNGFCLQLELLMSAWKSDCVKKG